MSFENDKRELTVAQAATELGLCEQSVRTYLSTGRLIGRSKDGKTLVAVCDNVTTWQLRQKALEKMKNAIDRTRLVA